MLKWMGCLFLLLGGPLAKAQLIDWNIGAGIMNETPGRYQTEVGGDKSKFNNTITLETELIYELDESWQILADFGLLLPGGEEEYISKQVFWLNGQVGWKFAEDWLLRAGGGVFMTSITGDGGTVAIRNGTGTTDFFIPEQRSTSRNVTLNLGTEYFFIPEVSGKFEAFIFNPLNSRNRTYNLALTARYHFGDSLWSDK
ncbi:MAG: transporter [Halobacteriovoraceae bacterium]|nr:transporter [Halobacteriovoraceae bacterium]